MDARKMLPFQRAYFWLLGGLLIGTLMAITAAQAFAQVYIYDTATLQYQNLAGIAQPDTVSGWVRCDIRGPKLSIAKEQKVRRYQANFSQQTAYVVSGDSVTYRLTVDNSGNDTAKNVIITDTQTFYDAATGGNSVAYVTATAWPDSGATTQGGYGKVTQLQYLDTDASPGGWVDANSATIPTGYGAINGLRWYVSYIVRDDANGPGDPGDFPGGAGVPLGEANTAIYFTIKFP